MPDVRIVNLAPQYFAAMEQLQRDCYPTLGEAELMRVPHYESQYRIFPQGQFVALMSDPAAVDGENVVGMGSGFYTDFDFEHPNHTFRGISDAFYFRTHDPDGEWYYGVDISVHPRYRGLGIGRKLYAARMGLVQRANRRGIVAGGLIPGYDLHRHLSPEEYVQEVVAGEINDPTLSVQLRMGFQVRGMLPDYIEDRASDHWSVLIIWQNPAYVEGAIRKTHASTTQM